MEPPSTRPWLGVGAALSALAAAGGCFCLALMLAVVADSDPGAVYQQHRWLGAIVAASAACAFVAMMGWATLRHGGLPLPVLLMVLVLAGAPFLLPGGLFLPAAAVAVAGCAALATAGLRQRSESAEGTRVAAAALTAMAVVLTLGQALAVDLVGVTRPPRAEVLAEKTQISPPARPGGTEAARAPAADTTSSRATPGGMEAARTPAPATPEMADPSAPEAAPPTTADARRFVRDYYAALDARDFAAAWTMLSPDVQRAFGGFDPWRKGYKRTISHAPGGLNVTVAGTGATVGLTLRAGDRGVCGRIAERRFAVTWRLAHTQAGLRATAATARKLSGPEPC